MRRNGGGSGRSVRTFATWFPTEKDPLGSPTVFPAETAGNAGSFRAMSRVAESASHSGTCPHRFCLARGGRRKPHACGQPEASESRRFHTPRNPRAGGLAPSRRCASDARQDSLRVGGWRVGTSPLYLAEIQAQQNVLQDDSQPTSPDTCGLRGREQVSLAPGSRPHVRNGNGSWSPRLGAPGANSGRPDSAHILVVL